MLPPQAPSTMSVKKLSVTCISDEQPPGSQSCRSASIVDCRIRYVDDRVLRGMEDDVEVELVVTEFD
jgi:hypothetical protein